MEKANSMPPEAKPRRALTPPLPEPPRITRSYSLKAATFFQNASPLFKLPRELRDEIYRYILASPELLLIRRTPSPDEGLFTSHCTLSQEDTERDEYKVIFHDEDVPHGHPKILGLLLSCRRVHTEAIEILYAKNSFYFEGGTTLPRWVEIVPPTRLSLIGHITLESPTCCGGLSPSVQVWSDMIKAAKGLKRLQSVTAILLPCVCNCSAVLELLYLALEAEFPALKILYQFSFADSTKGPLKGLRDDGVFHF